MIRHGLGLRAYQESDRGSPAASRQRHACSTVIDWLTLVRGLRASGVPDEARQRSFAICQQSWTARDHDRT